MYGRVIQSSAPIRYEIVDGMNVRDSRVHNYPSRWNGARRTATMPSRSLVPAERTLYRRFIPRDRADACLVSTDRVHRRPPKDQRERSPGAQV